MSDAPILAYVNGAEIALDDAKLAVNDRAVMFGDAVYEVVRVYKGRPFLLDAHLARLGASLLAMSMNVNVDVRALIMRTIAVNRVQEGMVYLQISRGEAHRSHSFHNLDLAPTIFMYAKSFASHPCKTDQEHGISAITHDDWRWARCDIKTVNLLPNTLIQTHAQKQGASEALLLRDGLLTEGTSSNVFLVEDDVYVTPPLSNFILPGTRRKFLLDALTAAGQRVIERSVEAIELADADEIFITSTVKEVVPVIALDTAPVGNGMVGEYTRLALEIMSDAIAAH